VFVQVAFDDDRSQMNEKSEVLAHRKTLQLKAAREFVDEEKQRNFSVFVGTWNVGNKPPPADLSPWIPGNKYDIYVIGTQECDYKLDLGKTVQQDFQESLATAIGSADDYKVISSHNLWQMRIYIFARVGIAKHLTNVKSHTEGTGIAGVGGNKGAVVVSMDIRDSRVCFVNSHLAAHQDKSKKRNEDVAEIIRGEELLSVAHQMELDSIRNRQAFVLATRILIS